MAPRLISPPPSQAVRHITDSTVDDLVRFLLAASEAYCLRTAPAAAIAEPGARVAAAAPSPPPSPSHGAALPGEAAMGLVRGSTASGSQRTLVQAAPPPPQKPADPSSAAAGSGAVAVSGGNSEAEAAAMYLSAYTLLVSDCAATAGTLESLDAGVDDAVTSALDLAGVCVGGR